MRLKVLKAIIFLSFLFLVGGLWYIQIVKGLDYERQSENNRIRLLPIKAPRGIIYDRNGVKLVDDRLSFDAAIISQELKDADKTLTTLSQILNIPQDRLRQSLTKGYLAPFAPIVVVRDIGKEKAIILEERRLNLPGLVVQTKPIRNYIYNKVGCHLLGYLGEIDKAELERLKVYGYKVKDQIGRSGFEKVFDNHLRGRDGGKQIEVNNKGRMVKILGSRDPVKGKDLHLTIDIRLQKHVDNLLDGRRGAIVVMNLEDGQILAMASSPGFDPNIFVDPGQNGKVKRVLRASGSPLLNRAISQYTPGSIFKVITASAGLEAGRISPHSMFFCGGLLRLGNRDYHCWETRGHGEMYLEKALTHSCNIFFYRLGMKLGVDELSRYAHNFGLGRPTGIELPNEAKGLVPTKKWKWLTKNEGWYEGDTVNFSIGQGYLLLTPLQALRMISIIAKDGELIYPHLVNPVRNKTPKASALPLARISNGVKRTYHSGRENPGPNKVILSERTIKTIKSGLKRVVKEEYGTGHRAKVVGIDIAGKTGTAQLSQRRSHGWFIGFAPANEPKVSFVVFLEHGGKGGGAPAEMAKEIVEFIRTIRKL